MAIHSGGDRTVAGRYELDAELGRGGMGVVWRAWDLELRREVALKEVLLPPGMDADQLAESHARVRREARSAARLAGTPGVIAVHDSFHAEDHPWIVMQLVHGHSLHQEIQRRGRLPPAEVGPIAATLLEALSAAHAEGIVHRDIKPGNVILADDGRVLLTDFGIATIDGETAVTKTGTLIGSPEYMAPERLEDSTAEPSSDLWSLGATLYAALEGRSPFKRHSVPSTIAAVLTTPLSPPQHAEELTPLITGLLDRDSSTRLTFGQARALLDAALSSPEPGLESPSGPVHEQEPSSQPSAAEESDTEESDTQEEPFEIGLPTLSANDAEEGDDQDHGREEENTDDLDPESGLSARTRWRRMILAFALIVGLVATASVVGARQWLDGQYFIGPDETATNVAVYQGVNAEVFGFSLADQMEDTGIALELLPSHDREAIERGVSFEDRGGAGERVEALRTTAEECEADPAVCGLDAPAD